MYWLVPTCVCNHPMAHSTLFKQRVEDAAGVTAGLGVAVVECY